MAKLIKIKPEMFDEVYGLLKDFDATNTKEQWRRIFDYTWDRDEDYVGYALQDQGRVVGFLGLIFSERLIQGKKEKFCNLSSWIVKKDYSSESIALILDVRNLQEHTLTNLTPSKDVYLILKQFGFQMLEDQVTILPMVPNFRSFFSSRKLYFSSDPEKLMARLSEQHRILFKDHNTSYSKQCIVYDGMGEYCYIIFKEIIRKKVKFNNILYMSHPSLFKDHASYMLYKMFRMSGALFSILDARILRGVAVGLSWKRPLSYARLFHSKRIHRSEIDNLYSEAVLLPIL
jgi:hypothetical protein